MWKNFHNLIAHLKMIKDQRKDIIGDKIRGSS